MFKDWKCENVEMWGCVVDVFSPFWTVSVCFPLFKRYNLILSQWLTCNVPRAVVPKAESTQFQDVKIENIALLIAAQLVYDLFIWFSISIWFSKSNIKSPPNKSLLWAIESRESQRQLNSSSCSQKLVSSSHSPTLRCTDFSWSSEWVLTSAFAHNSAICLYLTNVAFTRKFHQDKDMHYKKIHEWLWL